MLVPGSVVAATFLVPGNMTAVWWLGLCGTRSLVLLSDSVVASSCSVAVPGCKNFSMEAIYLGTRSLVAKVTVWWLAACQQMFLECLEWTEIQHLSCANGEQIISHPIGLVRPGTRMCRQTSADRSHSIYEHRSVTVRLKKSVPPSMQSHPENFALQAWIGLA